MAHRMSNAPAVRTPIQANGSMQVCLREEEKVPGGGQTPWNSMHVLRAATWMAAKLWANTGIPTTSHVLRAGGPS